MYRAAEIENKLGHELHYLKLPAPAGQRKRGIQHEFYAVTNVVENESGALVGEGPYYQITGINRPFRDTSNLFYKFIGLFMGKEPVLEEMNGKQTTINVVKWINSDYQDHWGCWRKSNRVLFNHPDAKCHVNKKEIIKMLSN